MISNELKGLKVSEAKRIQDLTCKEQEKCRKRLARKQEKEVEIAIAKHKEAYYAMIIEKETARELLDKKIHLQFNEIAKNQNGLGKVAEKLEKK